MGWQWVLAMGWLAVVQGSMWGALAYAYLTVSEGKDEDEGEG